MDAGVENFCIFHSLDKLDDKKTLSGRKTAKPQMFWKKVHFFNQVDSIVPLNCLLLFFSKKQSGYLYR